MIRTLLATIRHRTSRVARMASRFNRVTRYGLDLVLWSRLFSGQREAIPREFPPALLAEKGIQSPPPSLYVLGPPAEVSHWDEGFAAVYADLLFNLQTPNELSSIRYAHPGPAFRGIYLWDSAFIAQVWKHWDNGAARDVNRAVIELRSGDRLQHMVADFVESIYTQPPLLAWSIWEAGKQRGEHLSAELEDVYPALSAYNRWLYEHRRHASGLFYWLHPYESGIDNSPRFSSRDESRFADTRKLAAADLSAYVVKQNQVLADMAETLQRTDDAARFRWQADQLASQMNRQLWHERDGMYYDRDFASGRFVRSLTISSLIPLFAEVPDETKAARLCQHATDRDMFGTPIPLPSVARNDPDFSKDMWRGPVWINTAYMVLLGLASLGYERESADLAFRLCDGVYRTFVNCRRIFEFYDPERYDITELERKQGNRWKHFTLGSKPQAEFVGWSGLVNTLVIEHLLGFRYENGRRVVRPRFAEAMAGRAYSLRLPAEQLSLHFVGRDNREVSVSGYGPNGCWTRELGFGDVAAIDGS